MPGKPCRNEHFAWAADEGSAGVAAVRPDGGEAAFAAGLDVPELDATHNVLENGPELVGELNNPVS